MCGIFSFISHDNTAVKSVIRGLGFLEHRGYDSIGISYFTPTGIKTHKISKLEKGDIRAQDLKNEIPDRYEICNLAIGHNRWATFGRVSEQNAHPHHDADKIFYVVHNGNVENLKEVEAVIGKWARYSETDTEAIANLLAHYYKESKNFFEAVKLTINAIEGANVIAVMKSDEPGKVIVANRGGTVLLGQNGSGTIISSDPAGFESFEIKKQQEVFDNEIAIVESSGWEVFGMISREEIQKTDKITKSKSKEFKFFMEEEIFSQPEVIENALRGRILMDQGITHLDCTTELARELRKAETFHFVGCGTAFNACQYASLLLNRFGISARAWIASEFCYSHPVYKADDAFVFVSQSGETADSLEVLREIKIKGNICLGVVNVAGSRIWRETQAGIGVRAGKERGVASTKAYTAQLVSLVILAVFLARQRNMTVDTGQKILAELLSLPDKIRQILAGADKLRAMAKKYRAYKNYYFLGRYFHSVSASEGSLKLKEISYVHAESYPLGEMKHGPLALVDKDFCSVVVAPDDAVFKKSLVNMHEIKSRGGQILAIGNKGQDLSIANDVIFIPKTLDYLSPILSVIPLQLFSYYMARELGKNPDKPRNLAKTVTVS